MKLNKVLVPIEEKEFSLEVMPHLTRLLEPKKTELILFHVEPLPTSIMVDEQVVVYADQIAATVEADSKAAILPQVRELEKLGYKVTPMVSFGDPVKEIEHIVESKDVDLVAMTTHARKGFDRLVHGSVAERVFKEVDVPVLLLRGQSEEWWEADFDE